MMILSSYRQMITSGDRCMRQWLDYLDCGPEFARCLPCVGVMDGVCIADDGNRWAVFRPEAPLHFRGQLQRDLLLKWPFGDRQSTVEAEVMIVQMSSLRAMEYGFDLRLARYLARGRLRPV